MGILGQALDRLLPRLYRQLLNGFYAGVKSVEPRDTVVAAGIAPEGEPAGVGAMAPVSFLEALLCLRGATRVRCPEKPHFDVLAFHPLSVGNPDVPAASLLDVAIADMSKITGLLARAERLRTVLPAGRRPLWVTELNWKSSLPSPQGVPGSLQAAWVSRALHRLWVAGVSVVDWQFLIDPYGGVFLASPEGSLSLYSRPAGLYASGPAGDMVLARPKPFVRGFTLPFDSLRVNGGQMRVWHCPCAPVRRFFCNATGEGRSLAHDRHGVVNRLVSLSGHARLRMRTGRLTSASAYSH